MQSLQTSATLAAFHRRLVIHLLKDFQVRLALTAFKFIDRHKLAAPFPLTRTCEKLYGPPCRLGKRGAWSNCLLGDQLQNRERQRPDPYLSVGSGRYRSLFRIANFLSGWGLHQV